MKKSKYQFGGNLPGAVGNMYARIGAPSNGKYAKKTKPSAQDGKNVSSYVDSVLNANKHLPWVKGLYDKDYGSIQLPGQEGRSTHFMESSDGLVYPTIVKNKKGKLEYLGDKARDYAIKNKQFIQFPTDKEAQWFGENYKLGTNVLKYQKGGIIQDDAGQWAHPGEVTKINSNQITMKGVDYPVLGVSNTGHKQMMLPGKDYKFDGNSVIEYPSIQDKGQLKKLDQLTNFTNMGKAKNGKKLGKKGLKKADDGYTSIGQFEVNNPEERLKSVVSSLGTWYEGGIKGLKQQQKLMFGTQTTMDKLGGAQGLLNTGEQLAGGIAMAINDRKENRSAAQMSALSDVTLAAASTRPEKVKRKYTRPEDAIIDPNQMFPTYGTGSGVLAKNGAEIQNTYAPNDIYEDLGYQPLYDSDKSKSLRKAQFGEILQGLGGDQVGGLGSGLGSLLNGGRGKQTGAGSIGGTLGGVAGTILGGPLGGLIGKGLGSLVGGLVGGNQERQTRDYTNHAYANLQQAGVEQGAKNMQLQNSSFMKEGGEIRNPQLITSFNGISPEEFKKTFLQGMDTLRMGGHLRHNVMSLGGELQVLDGGHAETISQNPYLPDSGETVMFKGRSHEDGGMPIQFGKSGVEVEGGEPAVKLQNGGNDGSLTIFGNMKIPSYGVTELEDKNAKGKKFKNYIADLSKKEASQNKISDKGVDMVNDAKENLSPFETLKLTTGKVLMEGSNMKLKDIAKKKQLASIIQNAILETADEHGLESDALAEGKMKKAKYGAKLKAQKGKEVSSNEDPSGVKRGLSVYEAMKGIDEGIVQPGNYTFPNYNGPVINSSNSQSPYTISSKQKEEYKLYGYQDDPNDANQMFRDLQSGKSTSGKFDKGYNVPGGKSNITVNDILKNKEKYKTFWDRVKGAPEDVIKSAATQLYQKGIMPGKWTPGEQGNINRDYIRIKDENPYLGTPGSVTTPVSLASNVTQEQPQEQVQGKKRFPWENIIASAMPTFRPSNQMRLDPTQLSGEMYALSNNQLEPVQAQQYQPLLETPYKVSYQDIRNQNQADFNANARLTGNNPAAQAALAAQKYAANASVTGQEFRENQGRLSDVIARNRGTLNDATLKNLAILDQQYERQSAAKSNTKAIAQSALSSIADKIQRNKLENRTLGVYENLYNYRFGPYGHAWNFNGPAIFNTPQVGKPLQETDNYGRPLLPSGYDSENKPNRYVVPKEPKKPVYKTNKTKNGGIVKAIKNL